MAQVAETARGDADVDEREALAEAKAVGPGVESGGDRAGESKAWDGFRFTGAGSPGLTWERRWTRPGVHPYDEITWELRSAEIKNESGKTVFELTDVEVAAFWSLLARNVVVSKDLRGHIGTRGRERFLKELV